MEIIEANGCKYKIEYITESGYALSKWNGKRFCFGFGTIESFTEAKHIAETGGYESQMKIFKFTYVIIAIIVIGGILSLI